jgi:hypothetical protein
MCKPVCLFVEYRDKEQPPRILQDSSQHKQISAQGGAIHIFSSEKDDPGSRLHFI